LQVLEAVQGCKQTDVVVIKILMFQYSSHMKVCKCIFCPSPGKLLTIILNLQAAIWP